MKGAAFLTLKWWLYPGLNLHSRLRYRRIPRHFGRASNAGERAVLDAGSGNGMLSYKCWEKNNQVLGVSFKESEVEKCRELFNHYLRIPEEELSFRVGNLYSLDVANESFDEIICSETLEHLKRDEDVCRTFWKLLKPGGVLHLCAPNAGHPYNMTFPLDSKERGGHVRPGYTIESYKTLLEPIGFQVVTTEGLGGPIRQWFNARIKNVQENLGAVAGVPLFLFALPVLCLKNHDVDPAIPFSIYLQARKPAEEG